MNAPPRRFEPSPLAVAVAPFAAVEPAPEVDAAAVLADLIDLRGGVLLAELLAGLDAIDAAPDPEAPAIAARVRRRVAEGLDALEGRLNSAFENALRPRYRLPTAPRAFQVLQQTGALDARRGRPLKTATRTLWAPCGEFVETQLKRARFAIQELRSAVAPELRRLGPDAARLERLDAALDAATRHEVERLYRRVTVACEASFAQALRRAVAALPRSPELADLAEGFSAWGWLPEEIEKARGLVLGIVHRERARLEALVEAACDLGCRSERP